MKTIHDSSCYYITPRASLGEEVAYGGVAEPRATLLAREAIKVAVPDIVEVDGNAAAAPKMPVPRPAAEK